MPSRPDDRELPSGVSARESLSFRRRHRLRSSREIRETYEQGNRYVGPCMVLWIRRGDEAKGRRAVVASRKVGGAVQRNRAKRRIREVFRLRRPELRVDMDFVLVCRRAALEADWDDLRSEFDQLARRAGAFEAGVGDEKE